MLWSIVTNIHEEHGVKAQKRIGRRTNEVESSSSGELEPGRTTSGGCNVPRGTATRRSASSIGLPDERVVPETDRTVPVREAKRTKQGPTVNAALDRRKQFSGTDEHAKDRR